MIRLNNDYNRGAAPSILSALQDTSNTAYAGYGTDEWCELAAEEIRSLVGAPDADIRFFPGATQANFIMIAAALNSVQSVIAPETGHINCHEAASVEHTGRKILELPQEHGKITAEQIRACASAYYDCGEPEYLTEPKMVYISFPTENGTLYTKAELEAISAVCRHYGMYLFVDGARMGYGLGAASNDLTLQDFARLADVFYLGGTKCGAMFGEAVVITAPALSHRVKAYMKQNGAVLAKGWLLGLQFHTLLSSGEYFTLTRRADELALQIKAAFVARGIPLVDENDTNQQFVILTDGQKEKLAESFYFEDEGPLQGGTKVRFCTSWATTQEEVDALVEEIGKL